MRRFSAGTFGLLVVAVVIGCGPNKEIPTNVPSVKGSGPKTAPPTPKVPDTSDPAAKAVIEKAIAAITQKNPKLLSKGRVSRCLTHGAVQLPSGPMSDATRRIEAVWPDRARVVYQFKGGTEPTLTFLLRGPLGAHYVGPQQIERGRPEELGTILRDDLIGQHWLPLGVPLDDPRAIAFDVQKSSVNGRDATTLRFALPGQVVYELAFDSESSLLVRVEYTAKVLTGQSRKVMMLSDYKLVGGLMLPHALTSTENRLPAERWFVDAWEFPEKIEDSAFEGPK